MNLFVADPEWGGWIILYFFLGGIAAGAYFMATLVELFGHEDDRGLSRVGYWIAFPLVCLCGLFLIADLDRPGRFWPMLFRSEVVHGAPARFSDPARYSLAHGGKDGHPYPVPRRVYDETIRVMKDAVSRAKIGQSDRLAAIQRLDAEARRLERTTDDNDESGIDVQSFIAGERSRSAKWGGMTTRGPVG